MFIVINGPFGVGKTTAAGELIALRPDAILFDPELIGACLRRLLGPLAPADYQDLPLWRSLTVELAHRIHRDYGRTLVIPICLWRRDYFDELMHGLRTTEIPLACFRLTASRETLIQRILHRPDADGPHAWCLAHLDSGLAAANEPAFGTEIPTDGRSPREVAEQILLALTTMEESVT